VPVLTPDQFEQLQRILTDAFDKGGITELVRTKLGDRLDNLVDPDQPTPRIVFDLLAWIDRRDMRKLEVLLQGAIRMKPENGALRAFCAHNVPGALKPIDLQVYAKAEISAAPSHLRNEQGPNRFWRFLPDKHYQQDLGRLGGRRVVVAIGLGVVFPYFFSHQSQSPANVQANCGGIAIVGNVITGSTITPGATTSSDCAARPK
jgi:Effector-associated domain 1